MTNIRDSKAIETNEREEDINKPKVAVFENFNDAAELFFGIKTEHDKSKNLFERSFYDIEINGETKNLLDPVEAGLVPFLLFKSFNKHSGGSKIKEILSYFTASFIYVYMKKEVAKIKISDHALGNQITELIFDTYMSHGRFFDTTKDSLNIFFTDIEKRLKRIGGKDYKYSIADFTAYAYHKGFMSGLSL